MVSKGSSPCSQQPATFHILTQINPVRDFLSYFFATILILFKDPLIGLFPSVFPTETLYIYIFLVFPLRGTCPAHLNFLKFITPRSVTSTIHGASHYVFFYILLSLPPSAHLLSSACYSHTPSGYCFALYLEAEFHTHTDQQAKLLFCRSLCS